MKSLLRIQLLLSPLVFSGPVFTLAFAANARNGGASSSMDKVETASVKRFKEFDNLCKTCPTRLQPKISTLEEMIMGLSIEDREQLFNNVNQRIRTESIATDVTKDSRDKVQTPEDVYKFQTGVDPGAEMTPDSNSESPSKKSKNKQPETSKSDGDGDGDGDGEVKKKKKDKKPKDIAKLRSKYDSNKLELQRVQFLLDEIDVLLSSPSSSSSSAASSPSEHYQEQLDDQDSSTRREVEELRSMTRAELKLAKLEYIARKSKCEQKMAKCRAKLYAASMQLATTV